ncbi:hypothetical protein T01_2523 [Trichinella spiralis]|uniref:Uncharacterized protein n=1 Tax=Trichinella spiralis TaxID=6334 RepID=A0A0V1B8T8_TRISP|nr:hypothetical protein T01_2523 [Trichinella spiralis]
MIYRKFIYIQNFQNSFLLQQQCTRKIIGCSTFGFSIPTAAVIGSCFALVMAMYMEWNALRCLLTELLMHSYNSGTC